VQDRLSSAAAAAAAIAKCERIINERIISAPAPNYCKKLSLHSPPLPLFLRCSDKVRLAREMAAARFLNYSLRKR